MISLKRTSGHVAIKTAPAPEQASQAVKSALGYLPITASKITAQKADLGRLCGSAARRAYSLAVSQYNPHGDASPFPPVTRKVPVTFKPRARVPAMEHIDLTMASFGPAVNNTVAAW